MQRSGVIYPRLVAGTSFSISQTHRFAQVASLSILGGVDEALDALDGDRFLMDVLRELEAVRHRLNAVLDRRKHQTSLNLCRETRTHEDQFHDDLALFSQWTDDIMPGDVLEQPL